MKPEEMRYCSTGEVHLDFYGTTLMTVQYLLKHYGKSGLAAVLDRTAKKVYRVMHNKLAQGDTAEFIEFQRYYLTREGADFTLTEQPDGGAVLQLPECPGRRQVKKIGMEDQEQLCEACQLFHAALCEGTPWTVETVKCGNCGCCQTLKRRD